MDKEKNQSIETDPEITEMLEFAYKHFERAIIVSMPRTKEIGTGEGKRHERRNNQMKTLDLKSRAYKLQIQYMGLTDMWTLQKKKISELEERAIETIHLRHGDGKRCKRMNRKSVNCGITSSGLSFMRLES